MFVLDGLHLTRNPTLPLISGLIIDGHTDAHEVPKSFEVPSESANIKSHSLWVSVMLIHHSKIVREHQHIFPSKSRNLFCCVPSMGSFSLH